MQSKARRAAFAILPVLAAGCVNLAPEYRRPPLPVDDAFPSSQAGGGPVERRASDIPWREFFTDPRLRQMIERALGGNRDFRQAVLRIVEARGLFRIQRSERWPQVDGSVTATRSRSVSPFAGEGQAITSSQYEAGVAIPAFELDLFSRVRNATDSSLALYIGTVQAQRAAQLALIGQVGRAYLALRALEEQQALAEGTLKTREAALRVTRDRFDAGAASALELRLAQSLVESANVALAQIRRQRVQATNAIAVLVGTPIGDLVEGRALADQQFDAGFGVGLPSDVLTLRPDVLAAEAELVAAHADIGAARAAFFPRITLTASAGRASRELGDLFGNGTGVWSFVPQLLQPLFSAGRLRANVDVAEARRDIAVAGYERAIQVAFREVADALAAREMLSIERLAQERLVEAERARAGLTEQLFKAGVSGFLDYLDAQRQLFVAEQALVQVRAAEGTAAVDLYVALGGGLN